MKSFVSFIDNTLSSTSFRKNPTYSVLILLILILSLITMYPVGKSIEYNYNLDAAWTNKDLIANFSFPINKDKSEYNADIEKAKRDFIPIFRTYNTNITYNSILMFFDSLNNATLYKMENKNNYKYDSSKAINFINNYDRVLSTSDWDNFILLKNNELSKEHGILTLKSLQDAFLDLQSSINGTFILSINKTEIHSENIAIRENNIEKIYSTNLFFDETEVYEILHERLSRSFSDYEKNIALIDNVFHVIYEPDLVYDKEASDYELNLLIKSVPKTLGIVKEKETIISTNEKVTVEARRKIDSYIRARNDRMSNINVALQYIGKSLNTFVMLLLFIIYLYLFRKKIFHDNLMLLLIALLILFIASLAYFTMQFDTDMPIEYLIILPVSAMLFTIIFDSRVGFYSVVITSLIVSAIRGIDYPLFLSSIVAGSLAVYTVRDIKNRNQIFRSILYIMVGYAIAIISIGLESFDDYQNILDRLMFAGINSVLSPVLTFGFLIFFERVFKISTDITLLELSDFNHPLLKELSSKVPGTFHHSVIIGSLAEAGAEAIRANSLLARVGAYYHDIGKIPKPEYFIENQTSGKNKHDKLSPNMSTLIIISHVKEGIELAKKYNLPQNVIDFIQMHHGTTLVSYFYDKALRKRRAYREQVREIDFRYLGPKPTTKETAIVMLADSIEASIRTMTEPTLPQMEGLIDSIVRNRLLEGELDECNLTMLEIASIKKSFLNIFVGIHHKRIKYPEKTEPNK